MARRDAIRGGVAAKRAGQIAECLACLGPVNGKAQNAVRAAQRNKAAPDQLARVDAGKRLGAALQFGVSCLPQPGARSLRAECVILVQQPLGLQNAVDGRIALALHDLRQFRVRARDHASLHQMLAQRTKGRDLACALAQTGRRPRLRVQQSQL